MRVVENEGSFREYVKELTPDGSRRDWGASFLHAKPVTTGEYFVVQIERLSYPALCDSFSEGTNSGKWYTRNFVE
jgi:hypothetical protein